MSGGFVKIYGTILTSSVWMESASTRLVWITMLALAEQHGIVKASVPGLAHQARVSLEECEEALRVLSAPDRFSKSKDHDGRRIEEVAGGWCVLNYEAYRELRTDAQIAEAERKRVERQARTRPGHSGDVPDIPDASRISEQKSEVRSQIEDSSTTTAASGRKLLLDLLPPSRRKATAVTLDVWAQGYDLPPGTGIPTPEQIDTACREAAASREIGTLTIAGLRNFLSHVMTPSSPATASARPNGRPRTALEIVRAQRAQSAQEGKA